MAPQTLDGGGYPIGAIDGGIAVLGPGAAGVDVTNGAEQWSADESPPEKLSRTTAMSAVFAGQEGPVTALNISTGEEMWTAPGKTPHATTPAIGDAAVYVLDGSDIVAYELDSGTVRWRIKTSCG